MLALSVSFFFLTLAEKHQITIERCKLQWEKKVNDCSFDSREQLVNVGVGRRVDGVSCCCDEI